MVKVYTTVFGSTDLLQPAGSIEVSNSDRLRSFLDSYALGTRVIKDLERLLCESLHAKHIPEEHVLRLCLEHHRNFVSSHLQTNAYNFYKPGSKSSSMGELQRQPFLRHLDRTSYNILRRHAEICVLFMSARVGPIESETSRGSGIWLHPSHHGRRYRLTFC